MTTVPQSGRQTYKTTLP